MLALARGNVEAGRPDEPWREVQRLRRDVETREVAVHLRPPRVLTLRATDRHLHDAKVALVVDGRGDGSEHSKRIDDRLPLDGGVRRIVEIHGQMRPYGKVLLVLPGDQRVGASGAQRHARELNAAGDEPVEQTVAKRTVESHPARVEIRCLRAAPPIERHLGVVVIAQRKVVTDILDVSAVGGTVAEEFGNAEAWREDARAAPVASVLEDEREPHHGNVHDMHHD